MDARESLLVDLSQWLGRVQQYSPTHPMSAQMGEKTLASLGRALAVESPLAFGVLKEDVLVGENPAKHPTIKNRLAPHLHERGVLVLGMQPQNVFDKGGLARLARERGVGHVQIDEIAHELTSEEREAQRRRKKLGDFFAEMLRNMLARRDGDAGELGEHLAEMLEHPEIAVSILEADAAGIAEAAAGLALMTRQEEARSRTELGPKLRDVLLRLAPASRDRMLLGLPSLLGEFRAALAWAVEGLEPEQLARLFLPSIRAHATDLDATLYAAGAAVAHDGRRLSALRCAGRLLFDLPAEDAAAAEVLAALAAPVPDYDSYRRERECLREPAARARAARTAMPAPSGAAAEFDGRRAVEEVIALAKATRSFDRFAARLPPVAGRYAASGAVDGAIGVVGGLARAGAEGALREACVSSAAAILADLDRKSAAATPAEIDESSALVRHFVAHAPVAVLGRLDVSESRKMRRMLLDALPAAGASLLPELVVRLRSSSWFVVRNGVGLLARCGG